MSGDPRIALDASVDPESFLRAVLGSLGEAVFVVRPPDHRIVMINEAAGELFLRASSATPRASRPPGP